VDGDLVEFFAVDGLDVEGLEELFGQAVGCAGEDVAQDRQLVEQGGVVDLGGGGVELVALGFEGGTFGVEFAVAGADPFAEGTGGGVGGVVGVGGGFQFMDQGLLGGFDLVEPLVQLLGPGGAPGGFAAGVSGVVGVQHGGAVWPEHVLGEEGRGGGHEHVFTDRHVGVAGERGGVSLVAGVVGAPVVGVDGGVVGVGAGDAAHPPFADLAPQPPPVGIPAADPLSGLFGVLDVAPRDPDRLGGVPGGLVDQGGMGGLPGPDPLLGRDGDDFAGGDLVAAAEDLVAGVFGVGEDFVDRGQGPAPVRVGRRVGEGVGVEPAPDGRDAEPVGDPPPVDLPDHRGALRVFGEAGFGAALSGFHRVGVGVPLGDIAVGDGADVPAVEVMFL
jgi:hypothetical protein